MNHMGFVALFAFLIALGLVLRFGKTSHYLAQDFFSGTQGWLNDLTLQQFGGNTP